MSSVIVSHIEVVQSIQNATNEAYDGSMKCIDTSTKGGVPLITRKTTFVRVYFENFNPADEIQAKGNLEVEYIDGTNLPQTISLDSLGVVSRHENISPTLIDQRLSWGLSLNFKIPARVLVKPGTKKFKLVSLSDTITGQPIDIVDTAASPNPVSQVEFVAEKKLICRALIFRYRDVKNNAYLEPTREEVNTIRKFVERSFPVAKVDWSVIRVESQRDFFALDQATQHEREHDELATRMLTKMLHQIMTHRNQELKAGFHRKTHYIGVFSDPRGRFGSVAIDAPPFPSPHVVAACATDSTGENGAHEIGHILGRSHPGVPLLEVHGREIGQYRIDKFAMTHMGEDGHLSPPNKTSDEELYIGLDTNTSNSLPSVLPPGRTYDLMTYRDPRWLSAYSYREIYKRLACTVDTNFNRNVNSNWSVICSFDINQKDGEILSVLPTNYRTPQMPEGFQTLEQAIVRRAVDQLVSQLDWLFLTDLKNRKIWKIFITSLPLVWVKPLVPLHLTYAKYNSEHTVSKYNAILAEIVAKLISPPDETEETIISLLNSSGIAVELYEPDIRIFPNYSGAGGGPSCKEDDKQFMWDNGIDVYYRRVGSKDRFPFGLLQATVKNKTGTDEPPRSITLMIDKVVVDKYAQSFETRPEARPVAEAIFKLTDCIYAGKCGGVSIPSSGNGGACEDRPSSNSLVYDIRKDSYYLNFHWPMAVLRQSSNNEKTATITTTIQCWRSADYDDSDAVTDKWETVCVTNELRGQVWISPDLLEIKYDPAVERPSAKKATRSVAARKLDKLKFRISITVGFYEFFSDGFENNSTWYTASPILVKPRRNDRFRPTVSADHCPDDFQYDDGAPSLIDDYTSA